METSRFELIHHYDKYLSDLLSDPEAENYMLQVYHYLELMEPGTRLNLNAEGDKLMWLLVTVGTFLDTADPEHEYELNNDYTKLRRKLPRKIPAIRESTNLHSFGRNPKPRI